VPTGTTGVARHSHPGLACDAIVSPPEKWQNLVGVMLLATLADIAVFFATRPATAQPSTPIATPQPATAQPTAAPAATRQATAQPTPDSGGARRVAVTGHSEVAGQPDTALVQLGVETQAATAKQALAQNTTQAAAVRAAR
jgi:methylglyoxal synthase